MTVCPLILSPKDAVPGRPEYHLQYRRASTTRYHTMPYHTTPCHIIPYHRASWDPPSECHCISQQSMELHTHRAGVLCVGATKARPKKLSLHALKGLVPPLAVPCPTMMHLSFKV